MPDRETPRPTMLYPRLAVLAGMLYGPRLTSFQFVVLLVGLAPAWGRDVLRLAAAFRRFRQGRDPMVTEPKVELAACRYCRIPSRSPRGAMAPSPRGDPRGSEESR